MAAVSNPSDLKGKREPKSDKDEADILDGAVCEHALEVILEQRSRLRKGSRAYNRYQGDALHGPNPCIAPIQDGPFYAIKMVIGDLGTYAGIKTDANARALDADGRPIAGLMRPATTWRASWAATTPAPASRSARR